VIKSRASNWSIVFAGVSGALAVFLAAGAAHGLHDGLAAVDLERIQTAVRHQVWHALALLGTAALATITSSSWLRVAGYGLALASLLFCSGLYLLSFTGMALFGCGDAPGRPVFHGRLAGPGHSRLAPWQT